METGSQQPLPQGSPLLAYGTSRGLAINRKILALIAGIFVLALILFVAILLPPIQLPERTFLVATVRSHSPLPHGSPEAWTVATQSGMPSILGIALTDSGPEAFSATLFSAPKTSLHTQRNGLFVFISDQELPHLSSMRWISPSALIAKTIADPAFLRVIPSVFSPSVEGTIDGPIRNGTWETNIPVSATSNLDLPDTDAAIDLRAFPEAWIPVQRILTKTSLSFDSIDPPSIIGWNSTTGTLSRVDLLYEGGASSSTILDLASQVGLSDTRPYTLPDGDVVSELEQPTSILQATTTTSWTGENGTLSLIDSGVRLSSPETATSTASLSRSSCSSGRPVLAINQSLLENIFQMTGFSLALSVDRVEATVNHGKLFVCLP